jgi:hypothetical protein
VWSPGVSNGDVQIVGLILNLNSTFTKVSTNVLLSAENFILLNFQFATGTQAFPNAFFIYHRSVYEKVASRNPVSFSAFLSRGFDFIKSEN